MAFYFQQAAVPKLLEKQHHRDRNRAVTLFVIHPVGRYGRVVP